MIEFEVTQAGLLVGTSGQIRSTWRRLSWRWLRDHCHDPVSYDQITHQRRVDVLSGYIAPATRVSVGRVDDAAVLKIWWPEVTEPTWIDQAALASLLSGSESRSVPPAQLWDRPDHLDIWIGNVDDVIGDDGALRTWLTHINRYGFGRLNGFVGGLEQAEILARRIGYPRRTIFGELWRLSDEVTDHDDSAYSTRFLGPHTDGTYCHDAPGLQMFCCTEREGTGGESITVDGFALAEALKAESPAMYEVLTRIAVPGHYLEAGVHLKSERPVLRLDTRGHLRQVSFNNCDRSPLLLEPDEMDNFYAAYGRFQELANERQRWLTTALEPGDVLIIDNWRALHGRNAYTGIREFVGCYLDHEIFESRCRVLSQASNGPTISLAGEPAATA